MALHLLRRRARWRDYRAPVSTDQHTDSRRNAVRLVAFLALVAVSGLVLPLSAYLVEAVSSTAENWTIVVYVVVMAVLGGALGTGVRALSPPATSRRRAALIWGGLGMLAALCGALIWLVLVGG